MPVRVVKNEAVPRPGPVRRGLPFVLLFASGFCALVYQVVWTRELGLVFGHTVYAVSAVVTAFMTGLALGARLAGPRVDRLDAPQRAYGALEIGIALTALFFPLVPPAIALLLRWTWTEIGGHLLLFNVLRATVAFAALLPPCVLMGATLPAAAAWIARDRGDGAARAARLYAVNTLGATFGCVITGFLLIEWLGTLGTQLAAVAANIGIGLLAFAAPRPSPVPGAADEITAATETPARRVSRLSPLPAGDAPEFPVQRLGVIVAVAGLVALANEVAWTRALIFVNGTTTYAFSSLLAVYLLSVGAGSLAAAAVGGSRPVLAAWLRWVLVLAAIGTALSLYAVTAVAPAADRLWPPQASWAALVAGNLAKAAAAVVLPTAFLSMVLPLAIRLASHGSNLGEDVGRLYALNTAGGIVGAAVCGFVAIPSVGVHRTLVAGALLIAACAIAAAGGGRQAVSASRSVTGRSAYAAALVVMFAAAGVSIWAASPLHRLQGSEQLLYYAEGAGSTVSVVREIAGTKTIYIDGVPVAGTDPLMLTDQKSLAHVPMLLHRQARDVLTVGFGSGGASWSFSRYPDLASIDCVEIDSAVVAAAPHLTESNHRVWEDPRFRVILDDARSYLAYTDKSYDIISTDCTDLRYKSNASLYTTDYFGLCRRRLKRNGLVVVWMPLGGLSENMLRLAMRTFRDVFPHATLWYLHNLPTHYALLVGSVEPRRIDAADVLAAIRQPAVAADLAEVFLDRPEKIVNGLVLDETAYARYAGDGPINSDASPLLEFRAPREAYQFALSNNLRSLARLRTPPAPQFDWPASADATALRTRLAQSDPAVSSILAGHAAYQRQTFEYDEALRAYERAAALDPRDATLPKLIELTVRTRDLWTRELESRVARENPAAGDLAALASLYLEANRPADAQRLLERAVALAPQLHAARRRLAQAHAAQGDLATAIRLYEDAAARDPGSAEGQNDLGLLLLQRGDVTGSLTRFEAAIRADPGSAAAWHNLGLARVRAGDAAGSEAAYLKAIALDDQMVEAVGNLAALYISMQRPRDAVPLVARLRQLDPASMAIRVLEQRIGTIKSTDGGPGLPPPR